MDGSSFAEAAPGHAGELTNLLGAKLLLVRVVKRPGYVLQARAPHLVASVVEDTLGAARDYLAVIADGLRTGGRSATTRVALGTTPAAGIEQIAADEQVELVAMTTRARGGLARLVLGSVANELLWQSPVPLLLVRPGAPAAAIGLGHSGGHEGHHGAQGVVAARSHNVHGA